MAHFTDTPSLRDYESVSLSHGQLEALTALVIDRKPDAVDLPVATEHGIVITLWMPVDAPIDYIWNSLTWVAAN